MMSQILQERPKRMKMQLVQTITVMQPYLKTHRIRNRIIIIKAVGLKETDT